MQWIKQETEDGNYGLEVPDGVKITCPSGNCTLQRWQNLGLGSSAYFRSPCAFFNYGLNSRVDIEGIKFQEDSSTFLQQDGPIVDATKALVGFDNRESIADGPLISVAVTTKGSTYETKGKKIKGKKKTKKGTAVGSSTRALLFNKFYDVCILYDADISTPCLPILPPCASNLNDLYCMVNAPQKVVDICNGTTISFGTYDLDFNVDYYLPIVDEVKINCPTKDCILERRTFTATENCYPEVIGCAYHYFTCPFFTVDLNSHVTFEGLRFREITRNDAIKEATKELIAIDNLKLIPEPLTIRASTTPPRKGAKKRKGTTPRRKAALATKVGATNTDIVNIATDFSSADSNGDGLVDCNEAAEFLLAKNFAPKIECIKFLQHFTGSDAAIGVSYKQFEDVGLNTPSINEIFV